MEALKSFFKFVIQPFSLIEIEKELTTLEVNDQGFFFQSQLALEAQGYYWILSSPLSYIIERLD